MLRDICDDRHRVQRIKGEEDAECVLSKIKARTSVDQGPVVYNPQLDDNPRVIQRVDDRDRYPSLSGYSR